MTRNVIILLVFSFFQSFGQVSKIKVKKLEPSPALFPGGRDSLTKYFSKAIVQKLNFRSDNPKKINFRAWVDINELGLVTKVELTNGSTIPDIDTLFVDQVGFT